MTATRISEARRPPLGRIALAVAAGFVLAVLARVAVETAADPTSHNLWPFEVVIAGAIGLAYAGLGATGTRLTVGRGGLGDR